MCRSQWWASPQASWGRECHPGCDSGMGCPSFLPFEAAKGPGCYCGFTYPLSHDLGKASRVGILVFTFAK